jgi:hypothetical protein
MLPDNAARTVALQTVVIPHDPVNEQVILAAAIANDAVRDDLAMKLPLDAFIVPLHRQIWTALVEMSCKRLAWDDATLQQIVGPTLDMQFVAELQAGRPHVPPNLYHHVDLMLWDQARMKGMNGPIADLLEAVKDNRTDPAKIREFAKQVSSHFDEFKVAGKLINPVAVTAEWFSEPLPERDWLMRDKRTGKGLFPRGIAAQLIAAGGAGKT